MLELVKFALSILLACFVALGASTSSGEEIVSPATKTAKAAATCNVRMSRVRHAVTIPWPRAFRLLDEIERTNQGPAMLQALHRELGPIYRIRNPSLFGSYTPGSEYVPGEGYQVMVSDQASISLILKNTDAMGRDWSNLVPFLGRHSLFLNDESNEKDYAKWEKAHNPMAPFFTPASMGQRLAELQSVMAENIDDYFRYNENAKLDEFSFYMAYATNARFLFGMSPTVLEVERLRTRIDGALTPDANLETKGRLLKEIMDEALQINESRATPSSLYGMLKAAQVNENFPDNWLRDQMRTMLWASFETTQAIMAASLYELGQRPNWQDRLLRAGAQGGAAPPYRIPEIAAFLNETLRLYPPIPDVPRVAREDFVVNGRKIERGSRVILEFYTAQRDPSQWGKDGIDPETFDPDRLDPKGCSMAKTTAMTPFGDGPRICIGQYLARSEAAILLLEILKRYDVFTSDTDVPFMYPATLRVQPGVGLIVRPRAP